MALSAALADALDRVLADAAEARVSDYAAEFADVYQAEVPRGSGTLAGAFRADVTPQGAGRVVLHLEVDDAEAPHGKWINDPVDEIVPVRAKVLHWFGSGGGDVFAHRVVPSREHEGWWPRFVTRGLDAIRR